MAVDAAASQSAPLFAVAHRLSGKHDGGIAMTLDQVQHEAAALTAEERLKLAAFLRHIERVDSPAHRAELSRINRAMDAGERISLEQWQQEHAALEAKGL